MRTLNREIVSAIIISRDNKILMGMKDTNKPGLYKDSWHIPGGGVEQEEDLKTALKREVYEETAIDISQLEVSLVDDKGRAIAEKVLKTGETVLANMHFNVYEIKIDQEARNIKVEPNDDLVKFEWFDIDNLEAVNLTPPSIELFKRLKILK